MCLKSKLGKRIQEIRKQRKYTQDKLAEMVGIDSKNISRIENGNNYPSSDTIAAIARALDVNLYELFLFSNDIDYVGMKKEIIRSLDKKENILRLYKVLKGI